MTITQERLKEIVEYDPETGVFTWKINRKKCTAGSIVGSTRADGYVQIRLDYKRYYAHRLAWLYMMGEWPKSGLDHADGNPSNNKWQNIRIATPIQNVQNRGIQKNNKLGLKGVRRKGNKYFASIQVNKKFVYLGTHNCPTKAHFEYVQAAKKYFGEFARAL